MTLGNLGFNLMAVTKDPFFWGGGSHEIWRDDGQSEILMIGHR